MVRKLFTLLTWLSLFSLASSAGLPVRAGSLPAENPGIQSDRSPTGPSAGEMPYPNTQSDRPVGPQVIALGGNAELVTQDGGTSYAVVVSSHFAYIGFGARLVTLDISDPAHPVRISRSELLDSYLYRLIVRDNYLYALKNSLFDSNQYSGGELMVFDLSAPGFPKQVGSYKFTNRASDLTVSGNYAYIGIYHSSLEVVNISNPEQLESVGSYSISGAGLYGVDVQGNYAFLAVRGAGLQILNVSDPAHPSPAGSFASPGYTEDVAVSGDYAYLAEESVVRVVKITDPSHPVEWGVTDLADREYDRLVVSGHYVYALSDGLYVIDVLDPAHPVETGSYDLGGRIYDVNLASAAGGQLLAFLVDQDTGLKILNVSSPSSISKAGTYAVYGAVYNIKIAGSYAFLTSGRELRVLSIANPARPIQVGSLSVLGSLKAVQGNYAYLTRSFTEYPNGGGLTIVDISNPQAPHEVGFYEAWPPADIYIHPDSQGHTYAYLADDGQGLIIVNVTDPAHPSQVGVFDTPGSPRGVVVAGPDTQGHSYAYVADDDNGLVIVDVTDPSQPVEAGHYANEFYSTACAVALDGSIVYLVNDLFSSSDPLNTLVTALDVSNATQPQKLGEDYATGNPETIEIVGHYAYLAQDWANLQILDLSDHSAADWIAGFFRTPTFTSDVAVSGDFVYLADGDGGLYMVWFGPDASAEIPLNGGELTSSFDQTSYLFASDTFTSTVSVYHRPRYSGNVPRSPTLTGIGHFYETSAHYQGYIDVEPTKPYTVTIHYSDEQVPPQFENTLAVYYWDGSGWVKEPSSSLDVDNNIVRAQPDHFSLWGVLHQTNAVFLPVMQR